MEFTLNTIAIMGTVAAAPEQHGNVYGQKDIYALLVDTLRDSGIADRIFVLVQTDDSVVEELEVGSQVEVIGQLQTHKNWDTGRMQLFVWATYLAEADEDSKQLNNVHIVGEVFKKPVYRETPKGRSITDVAVRIPSVFAEGYACVIPCIAWGKYAEEVARMEPGQPIYAAGRLQSREYLKDGQTITTWEVSINMVQVKE